MKKPTKIRILHRTIPIRWDASSINRASREEGEPLHGIYRSGEILVSPDVADVEKETLLHEILHALIDQTALSSDGGPLSGDNEEQVIRTLSPLLFHTLRNNAALTRWLIE
jgi:hypothetical protein